MTVTVPADVTEMPDVTGTADVAEALPTWCERARSWPLPGSRGTAERLELLTSVSAEDLVVGRLVEAHADALAILAELGGPRTGQGEMWGVWAAGPPDGVEAHLHEGTWQLSGTKGWCSGAGLLTHALVDASTADGQRLFAVALGDPRVWTEPSSWAGPGMVRSDTRPVTFDRAAGIAVGGPGDYLTRPGFWAGAGGVAACWHGGTIAVASRLVQSASVSDDPHLLAHLGAVHAAVASGRAVLQWAAAEIDQQPAGDHFVTAMTARAVVERSAVEVMDRVGRALGPGPLALDARHAALVADLTVYIRQHHAERDLAALGRRIADDGGEWSR